MTIQIRNAHYIKLGSGGSWEREAIAEGVLLFGYHQTPMEMCERGDWDAVKQLWLERRKGSAGAATRDTQQIRTFHESTAEDVFITIHDSCLYWCRPTGAVWRLDDDRRCRKTLDGWHRHSITGTQLSTDQLSGRLLRVQGFRGTICQVGPKAYLERKINGIESPDVLAARQAEEALVAANIALMKQLTWQDFELLVDLVFAASGWRRVGVMGKTQKHVDLELLLPTTQERGFVQVKASTNQQQFLEYWETHELSQTFHKMFFVWHTGKVVKPEGCDAHLIGPNDLARMVVDAGLSSWLRDKAS
ncbi:hypothetical protein ACUN9V_05005 [Salinicola sp. V024]|uniref:hypothetical protein n=1 Tax=Salinicola sp. V024 TaxID=3459609 RepID=UPI004043974C